MREYIIRRKEKDEAWDSVPVLNIDSRYKEPCDHLRAWAQIAYNDEAILVHLFSDEINLRAEEHGTLGNPCEDSCLEFFFSPNEGDQRYFNIEFNPNGCQYLGIGSNIDDLVRLIPQRGRKEIFEVEIKVTEEGWEVFYRVPYTFIRRFFPDFAVFPGKQMRANCFKCGDRTVPPHYLTWNPIGDGRKTFHRPDCFGMMTFE